MITAFAILGALSALAVGWILVRALGRDRAAALDARIRKRLNVAAFNERLDELRAAHERGDLDAEQFVQAKTELEARLVREAGSEDAGDDASATVAAAPPKALVLAVLLSPLAIGASAFLLTDGRQHFPSGAVAPGHGPDVEQMVATLAERMQDNPDDVEGWTMLGRSYSVMQRHAEAAAAYARANAVTGGTMPDLLVAEGESLAMARDRDLLGRPQRLFEQALAIDPQHIRALWFAGLAARQDGDDAAAAAYFGRLQKVPDLPPELAEILGTATAPASAAPASEPPAEEANGASVAVAVTLDSAFQAQVEPSHALFVFARAQGGPPMPLAVQRLSAGALPLTLTLDDSMGMVAGMTLSRFESWELVARVSRSGEAQARSGDLQGRVLADRNTEQPIQIVIDSVVP